MVSLTATISSKQRIGLDIETMKKCMFTLS